MKEIKTKPTSIRNPKSVYEDNTMGVVTVVP